jgi:hypothetical protein
MPRTITSTVYTFDELSDRAKDKARAWFREGDSDADTSCTYEDAAQCAEILGIDLRTRAAKLYGGGTRMDPCIYYSGFSSQGDGACFEGSYSYAKGASKAIRAHAGTDTELHRIADALQELQRKHFYGLEARMAHSGHYYHSGCMTVDVTEDRTGNDAPEEAREELTQLMRDFADWIYKQLESEYDWRNADAQVDESILANECTFDAEGRREG